jgi:hypothetical protein
LVPGRLDEDVYDVLGFPLILSRNNGLVTAKEQPRLDGQPMETTSCSTHSPASGSERSLAVKPLSQALGWGHADFPKWCGPLGYGVTGTRFLKC